MTTTATKTQRRTAKITSAPRGYVAIQCDYIAAKTARIACVAKCDMEIKGANGATVSLKAGEAFHLVRSESLGDNWFYIVREVTGEKRCSCPANKPCKHEVSTKAHIAEHGRPAIHLRAREIAAEASKARAAQVATRETKVVVSGGYHYEPQYRDGDGAWQSFKDEKGEVIWFCDGPNADLAHKYVAVDSDEHRQAVWAEYEQRLTDACAEIEASIDAEEKQRDLVAVAASNAAKAGQGVDKALIASEASSARRLTSTLNGNSGFSLMAK